MASHDRVKKVVVRLLEVLVLVAVAALMWSNYSLRARQRTTMPASRLSMFSVGERLHQLPLRGEDGADRSLDLTKGRVCVAVLNPTCGSCGRLLAELSQASGLSFVVLGAHESWGIDALARKAGLQDRTYTLGPTMPLALKRRFVGPQVFIVDRGIIVRTCRNVAECR